MQGDPRARIWAIENLPEVLWARGVLCPAERAVMLGATSKGVRALLARMQRGAGGGARGVECERGRGGEGTGRAAGMVPSDEAELAKRMEHAGFTNRGGRGMEAGGSGSGVMWGGLHARVVGVRGDDEWVRASRDSLLSVAAAENTVATSARP